MTSDSAGRQVHGTADEQPRPQASRAPGSGAAQYLRRAAEVLARASEDEQANLLEAATRIVDRLARGGLIHTFGTGHSHLMAEEVFYRAGGLARVNPLLVDALMLHVSASGSSALERQPGLAAGLMKAHPMQSEDVLILASNSGGNAVSVELAVLARQRGVLVIALTSLKHARSALGRSAADSRLHEEADIVLDNHGEPGDACIPVPGSDAVVGPTSTVVGAALLNALMAEVTFQMVARGLDPEIFTSANTSGGDERNAALIARYQARIRAL